MRVLDGRLRYTLSCFLHCKKQLVEVLSTNREAQLSAFLGDSRRFSVFLGKAENRRETPRNAENRREDLEVYSRRGMVTFYKKISLDAGNSPNTQDTFLVLEDGVGKNPIYKIPFCL